ncbi:hypothetical protein FISHEDRAFT_33306 [Fistulina hepatica ATCC 64428]|uniref:Protein kinase domain-containing protein n=1 Tax=Fistulina hepatica ATCC 64428 TaxID=1128425 RepID=A0A0D7APD6_9AGAR|nr:hypothetical protein FISHEDRAFT_33306 [Fistulina hepatica ATCC 64428]
MDFPTVRQFRDSHRNNTLRSIRYIESLVPEEHHRLTFHAETLDDKQQVVVKFVYRYGIDAHRLLASHNLAPKLLYDGTAASEPRFGPLMMVVVEYVDTAYYHFGDDNLPKDQKRVVFDDVERAIALLHKHVFVFGDLRKENVLVVRGDGRLEARLIDFDCAGKCEEARWSAMMNTNLD